MDGPARHDCGEGAACQRGVGRLRWIAPSGLMHDSQCENHVRVTR
jgi:hypothetical protein